MILAFAVCIVIEEDWQINARIEKAEGCGIGTNALRRVAVLCTAAALIAGCHYSVVKRLDLWRKKLRVHTPARYSPISVEEMIALQPGCPFKESQVPEIDRQERRAVVMEGHLVRVEQLADGKTYAHLIRRGDIHLEIASAPDFHPAASSAQRVICEVTVPFQWRHKQWNLEGLTPIAGLVTDTLIGHSYPGGTPGGARVRVSGYLLDDFVHCAAVGRSRATAWEIHPITKLETWNEGRNRFEPVP
jgi:hypothetical protein